MVKILGICGSPRKKSSYKALSAALAAANLADDVEIEMIELRGKNITNCVHCNKCLRDKADRCSVFTDDMTELYDKFYGADGILIASPVYEMNITPQLASFFSRFRSAWMIGIDQPYFFMKMVGSAIAVGGTRNGGQEATITSIVNFYNTQGMTLCNGGSGIYGGASLWNPGDGSTEMEDAQGMKDAESLGKKLVIMARIMKEADIPNN